MVLQTCNTCQESQMTMGSKNNFRSLRNAIINKKRKCNLGWRKLAPGAGIHWQMLRRIALGEQYPSADAYLKINEWLKE